MLDRLHPLLTPAAADGGGTIASTTCRDCPVGGLSRTRPSSPFVPAAALLPPMTPGTPATVDAAMAVAVELLLAAGGRAGRGPGEGVVAPCGSMPARMVA